ncbi:UDP-2,3-diacylglucosamine diphosphatase [Marinagarivorans algicola]|uniref:UDP-2,3-diacylglucosamine diphosphatase n=1 Tax=Marinagarivorans algicola TaxID=1513270 RepID=UPI0006B57BF6|nr:UDP-2,3-diacylglucosamine diphosphatase [Marinagarivorans algicola]
MNKKDPINSRSINACAHPAANVTTDAQRQKGAPLHDEANRQNQDTQKQHASQYRSDNKPSKAQWRSVFISDVHLGTKNCKASALNQFLKHHPTQNLYMVGDILDGWKMRDGVYWKPAFSRVVKRIFKLSKMGVKITYITGNHDEFLRKYANNRFDNINLVNKATHITANNRRLLIIHGDQFEGVARASGLLRFIGDHGYELLMFLNRQFNRLRAQFDLGYWSFSGFLKTHLQRAQRYINDYEHAVAYGAQKQGYDGVVCGHIHQACARTIDGVAYYNTGDWVESCTAIVEDFEGNLSLVQWLDDPRYKAFKKVKKQRKNSRHLIHQAPKHPLPIPTSTEQE